MRHHKAGATVHKLVKGRLHLHLRTGVNRAGRFIKQQDLWVAEHDAGDAQQLPLALRQRASALAYHRVEPPGQCADETVRMRPDSRPLNLLARRARSVTAVELDRRLEPVLSSMLEGCENARVLYADALKTDLSALTAPGARVVANLPYYITTPILERLFSSGLPIESITVLIQKEVAQRICAQPGTAAYGAFTLLCQYYADREILYDVPPSCFLPAPKVVSSVLRMTVRGQPPVPVADEAFFFRLVRAAFGQRRKTLVNVLYPLLEKRVDKQTLAAQLVSCNLTEDIRGERLTFAEFAQLTEKLTNLACIKTCKEI